MESVRSLYAKASVIEEKAHLSAKQRTSLERHRERILEMAIGFQSLWAVMQPDRSPFDLVDLTDTASECLDSGVTPVESWRTEEHPGGRRSGEENITCQEHIVLINFYFVRNIDEVQVTITQQIRESVRGLDGKMIRDWETVKAISYRLNNLTRPEILATMEKAYGGNYMPLSQIQENIKANEKIRPKYWIR